MAAIFLAKIGTINIYIASSLHRGYNNSARSVSDGVITITSSRYFASHGNNEREKSKEEGMGITTDGKAPNVTISHAADTAKDGLKRAIEKSGDASKPKSVENAAVGENGTVKGQNQSSG